VDAQRHRHDERLVLWLPQLARNNSQPGMAERRTNPRVARRRRAATTVRISSSEVHSAQFATLGKGTRPLQSEGKPTSARTCPAPHPPTSGPWGATVHVALRAPCRSWCWLPPCSWSGVYQSGTLVSVVQRATKGRFLW